MAGNGGSILLIFAEGDTAVRAARTTAERLQKRGLEVRQHGGPVGKDKPSGGPHDSGVVLEVSASPALLHREACRRGAVKRAKGGSDQIDVSAMAEGSYEAWTPAERAWLVCSMVEDLRAEAGGGDKRLVRELRESGLVEDVCAAHEKEAALALWAETGKSVSPKAVPVEGIREYYGEGVAFYFAWMRFMTVWLAVPGVAGFLLWAFRPEGVTVDDSPYIPFFSLLMCCWGVLFTRYWQRQETTHAWEWGTYDLARREVVRPEFFGETVISDITGKPVKAYKRWKRWLRYLFSAAVTGIMLLVALGVMIVSLNLQGYIKKQENPFHVGHLYALSKEGEIFDPNGPLYFSLLPVVIHAVTIYILNAHIYCRIAVWLTDFENHRTEHDWESALIAKRFFFEAFDSYISLFYIAFWLRDVVALRQELVGLYTTDSVRRVLVETVLPLLLEGVGVCTGTAHGGRSAAEVKRTWWTVSNQAKRAEYEAFDDYLEMVIQIGYVTLFASSFPLASALSVFCNIVEIKSDGFKLTFAHRRPRPTREAGIGAWGSIVRGIVWLSIITNTLLFAFSSDQLAVWMPWLFVEDESGRFAGGHHHEVMAAGSGRVVVAVAWALEHAMGLLALVLLAAVPPVTGKVQRAIARRDYLAEEARRREVALEAARLPRAQAAGASESKGDDQAGTQPAEGKARAGAGGKARRRKRKGDQAVN